MLKRNSIKAQFYNQSFDKRRFWLGITVGTLSAFIFYCFLNLVCFSAAFIFHLDWVGYSSIVHPDIKYYHFFFAFIGLIMGQLIFLDFFVNKNRRFRESRFKKFNAFTNTRFAIWSTFFVGFSWAVNPVLLAFSIGSTIYNFKGIGWWACLLIIIWLQFYVASQFYKIFNKGFYISLTSFLGVGVLALLFSQIQLVDYTDVYLKRVENFPHYKLKIDLPVVPNENATSKIYRRSLVKTIFVGDPEKDGLPNMMNSFGGEILFDDINLFIETFTAHISKRNRHGIIYSLAMDKDLKMKYVYSLLRELGKNGQPKVSFAALNSGDQIENIFYERIDKGILTTIPCYCDDLKPVVEYIKMNPTVSFVDLEDHFLEKAKQHCELFFLYPFEEANQIIKINSDHSIFYNNQLISSNELFIKIKNALIEEKNKAIFLIDVDFDVKYEQYFFIRHEFKRAFNEVRNEEAKKRFGEESYHLSSDQRREIRNDFPMILQEHMTEEERFIYDFLKNKKL